MRLSAAGSHLRLQRLATSALLLCGVMIFIGNTSASGDSIDLEITIRQGLESQAVIVGILILVGVYALIVTEVVHRTLAAALGGLVAVGALQYYSGSSLSLAMVTTMIDWETIGLLLGMMVCG
jgi:hypothetical protein